MLTTAQPRPRSSRRRTLTSARARCGLRVIGRTHVMSVSQSDVGDGPTQPAQQPSASARCGLPGIGKVDVTNFGEVRQPLSATSANRWVKPNALNATAIRQGYIIRAELTTVRIPG